MKTSIDAMKQALQFLKNGEYHELSKVVNVLSEALAAEEAQTVEPVGGMTIIDGEVDDFECYPGVTLADGQYSLFTHPPQATEPAKLPENCGSGHCSCIECLKPVKTSAGEREALIEDLRALANELSLDYRTETIDAAAAMLAADTLEISQKSQHLFETLTECEAQALTIAKLNGRLLAQQVAVPQPPFGSKRKAAMVIYSPPFVFKHSYVFDYKNNMVADQGGFGDKDTVERAVALQIRGWGRIGYLPNAAELQDEVGAMCVDALNANYATPQAPMTAHEINSMYAALPKMVDVVVGLVRAVEAHYGIGVQP